MTPAEQLEAWRAWACPAQPSTMRDEPALARLRERWPLDGGGEGPRDYEALQRVRAAPREQQARPGPVLLAVTPDGGELYDGPEPDERDIYTGESGPGW